MANRIQQHRFGKHKLGINPKTPLKLINDRVYYGSLFFGSSSQEMQLMIDTGSEVIAVQTIDCEQEYEKFCHEG